jgi:hypothetical protein
MERVEGDYACGDEDCRLLCLSLWNRKNTCHLFDLLKFVERDSSVEGEDAIERRCILSVQKLVVQREERRVRGSGGRPSPRRSTDLPPLVALVILSLHTYGSLAACTLRRVNRSSTMSSSTWSETGSKSGSPLSSPPPPPPLFRPSDSRSPTPGGADQQHGSQTMQASSTKSPSTIIECILPKPGSYRRAVYDSVIADFPDVSPPYLLHRMNVHRDDAVKVIDELFGGGYPLAQGGFQVRVDPPAEGGAKDEDSSQPGLKHHVECQCCLEEVPLSQVGESGEVDLSSRGSLLLTRIETDRHNRSLRRRSRILQLLPQQTCFGCHCKQEAGGYRCPSFRAESRGRADVELFRQELTCFAIGTVCAASFPPVELKRAVPRPLLDKLDDLQLQVDLDQADLADLEKCP